MDAEIIDQKFFGDQNMYVDSKHLLKDYLLIIEEERVLLPKYHK